MRESLIQLQILSYLESRLDILAWRNNTGTVEVQNRRIKFGTKGSADILGVLAPSGRFVGIEVKTSTGRVSPAQIRWGEQLQSHGGLYVVARSVEDVRRALGEPAVKIPTKGRVFPGATPG